MLDGAGGGSAAAPEPAVTVLGGPAPGVRLLRPTNALDDTAGRALQRVAADVLACAPPRTTSTICSSCTRPWMGHWRPCDGAAAARCRTGNRAW